MESNKKKNEKFYASYQDKSVTNFKNILRTILYLVSRQWLSQKKIIFFVYGEKSNSFNNNNSILVKENFNVHIFILILS